MWARMQAQYTMETGRPDPTFQDLLDEQLKEEDPGEDGHAAYKPPSRRGMMKLRDVVAAQRLPTEPAKVRAMMVGIVDYCRGASPTIPHVVIAPLRRRAPPRRWLASLVALLLSEGRGVRGANSALRSSVMAGWFPVSELLWIERGANEASAGEND
jgi:hypothetical protein